jgi:amino acid transporter
MVGTVVLNMICGFIFLVPLCFVLPDISILIAVAQPFPVIISSAIGNEGGAFALTVPIIVLGIICGTGCTTASSRCTWAFARDGAIPGSRWWKQVNRKLDVPLNAMMLIMVIEILLGLIYFGSTAAFNGFGGAGVIFLTIAYVMPIIASLMGGRKALKQGAWDFGAFGLFCNIVAIAWTLLVTPLFSMPSYLPVPADGMNYASAVFAGGVIVSAIWYFVWGRKNYQGPPAKEEEVARRRSSVI